MRLILSVYEDSYMGITYRIFINGEESLDSSPTKIEYDISLMQFSDSIIVEPSFLRETNLQYLIEGTEIVDAQINDLTLTITTNYRHSRLNKANKYCQKSIDNLNKTNKLKHFCVGSNEYYSLEEGAYLYNYFISTNWKENNPDLFKIWQLNNQPASTSISDLIAIK